MSSKTRLGIGSLVESGMGSIKLPKEVTLFCPQCGTEVADKGQCSAQLVKIPGNSKTDFVLKLLIDECRVCGCFGQEPGIEP